MKALLTITRRGAVTLPTALRRRDNIKAGEEFEVERIERGEYLLRRKHSPRNAGLVVLLFSDNYFFHGYQRRSAGVLLYGAD